MPGDGLTCLDLEALPINQRVDVGNISIDLGLSDFFLFCQLLKTSVNGFNEGIRHTFLNPIHGRTKSQWVQSTFDQVAPVFGNALFCSKHFTRNSPDAGNLCSSSGTFKVVEHFLHTLVQHEGRALVHVHIALRTTVLAVMGVRATLLKETTLVQSSHQFFGGVTSPQKDMVQHGSVGHAIHFTHDLGFKCVRSTTSLGFLLVSHGHQSIQ